jgi:hypothetical protein
MILWKRKLQNCWVNYRRKYLYLKMYCNFLPFFSWFSFVYTQDFAHFHDVWKLAMSWEHLMGSVYQNWTYYKLHLTYQSLHFVQKLFLLSQTLLKRSDLFFNCVLSCYNQPTFLLPKLTNLN